MRIEYVIVSFIIFIVVLLVIIGVAKPVPGLFDKIMSLLGGAGG
ncbi:MAG TPA: hypothetical protein VJB11_01845 [archaeon]|nr:hypothetical protein [archaeon]